MFGNNITNPYMSYSPIMQSAPIMNIGNASMMGMRGAPMAGMGISGMIGTAPRSGGLLSSLFGLGGRGANAGSLLSGTRTFNFGNLLNSASKALGVVNQAIPIVKEVGPMMGNMKSMLKLASVFKDETDSPSTRSSSSKEITSSLSNIETTTVNEKTKENDTKTSSTTINKTKSNEPNFFL